MKTYSEEKRIRPHILTAAVYLAVLIMMVYFIVAVRICGEKGVIFAVGPFFIYAVFYCSFVLAVQKAVYIMVRLRARRSQFHNAETNMLRSMRIFSISSLVAGGLLIALSYTLCSVVLGTDRGFIQLIIAGASIVFLGVQGVLRGYLQGIGYTKPIVLSDLLIALVSIVSGTIAVGVMYNYGLKVNKLLHANEFSAVYGSTGLMAGIFIGSLVGFIQTVISYHLRKAEIQAFVKNGAPRYLDNKNDVLAGIRPLMPLYATPALAVLVDLCFYCIFTKKMHKDIDYMASFGIYAGYVICTIALFALICTLPYIKSMNRVMARIERDEFEGARDRYRRLIRFSNMFIIPVSVFVFATAETILIVLFGKSNALDNSLLSLGGLMIMCASHAIMSSWLLNHMGKSVAALVNLGIGWAFHIILLVLFVWPLNMGVMGVLLSGILAVGIYDAFCYLMISRVLHHHHEWMMSFVLPLASAAAAGLVVFLLNKLLINVIGDILTLIVCALIFWLVYMLVMVVTGGLLAHELKRVPFGNLFYGISTAIRRDRYEEG